MGALFSRARSPATELERVALEIVDLERKIVNISKRHAATCRYYYSTFVAIFVVVFAHIWLRYDNPVRTYYSIGVGLTAIFVIFIGRYFINAFYNWRTKVTVQKLEHSNSQKQALLDVVKETLNFKEAKKILDRYEKPENKSSSEPSVNQSAPTTPIMGRHPIHQRNNFTPTEIGMTPNLKNSSVIKNETSFQKPMPDTSYKRPPSSVTTKSSPPMKFGTPNQIQKGFMNKPEPIRPYLRQNGPLDRILDYFMSDGPSCRMALICKNCGTHNGMALPAEVPFLDFRCFECKTMNRRPNQGNQKPPPPQDFSTTNTASENRQLLLWWYGSHQCFDSHDEEDEQGQPAGKLSDGPLP
ncbi:unnamed protein product [Caenorhabditis bovis]|uniref:Endoplasmic reticulum junction formation protein lunapark n=1 Tax=Caenorhabditis bovis TaxID=2654633 RepID=A0A8S1EI53_9PELO|nr:unnamed protein product [Caenorhabditis bovis]